MSIAGPREATSISICWPSRATRVTRAPGADANARGATAIAPLSIRFTASGIVGAAIASGMIAVGAMAMRSHPRLLVVAKRSAAMRLRSECMPSPERFNTYSRPAVAPKSGSRRRARSR